MYIIYFFQNYIAEGSEKTKILFTVQEHKKKKIHYRGFETIETNENKNQVTKKTIYYPYESKNNPKSQEIIQEITYLYEKESFKPIKYHFINYQTQEEIKTTIEKGYFVIQTRFDASKKFKVNKKIEYKKGIIIGKSLHQYISTHWKTLEKNSSLKVEVLIPSKERVVTFVIKRKLKKNNKVHIQLQLNNFFFRIFAGDINLYFEEKNQTYNVREYIGSTPIPINGSKSKKAHFHFSYSQHKKK